MLYSRLQKVISFSGFALFFHQTLKQKLQTNSNLLLLKRKKLKYLDQSQQQLVSTFSTTLAGVFFWSTSSEENTQPVVDSMSSNVTTLDDLIRHADQLFDENQYQEAYNVLKDYSDQTLAEIKWRQARALFKLSNTDKNRKESLIRDSYKLMEDALAINDKDFAIHKWMAILLDAKSELDGIKARVSELENVKKHMEIAVELNPEDPTSWHLLGNFAFSLADMPWYQRKVVSAFFATPPTGTYEEALGHFLKAEEKQPGFYSINILYIAKAYQRLKNNEKAKEYLQMAASIQVLNDDDKRCKEEATELLKKY